MIGDQKFLHDVITEGLRVSGDAWNPLVSSLTQDSREVVPGSLFFAAKGEKYDARRYIREAIARGAAAVIAEQGEIDSDGQWQHHQLIEGVPVLVAEHLKEVVGPVAACFYGYPSRRIKVVGITGTNGKTTCSHLIAGALQSLGATCGLVGTLGHGEINHLQPSEHTTPQAVQLQQLLAGFVKRSLDYVVVEVSSHGIDQQRVAGVEFNTALFTNISRDHLDYHGSRELYVNTKQRLVKWPALKTAILNADDDAVSGFDSEVQTETKSIQYSAEASANADVVADSVALSTDGMCLAITVNGKKVVLESHLLGQFNVSNLLAALAFLVSEGFEPAAAAKALGEVGPIPGRMQRVGGTAVGKECPVTVIDYAHTPDALGKALLACRDHAANRLICVFGCGGDRDRGKRKQMGEVAARLADIVILTNDNPRTESPDSIVKDIRSGMSQATVSEVILDREEAISAALAKADLGDCILVAGKGHEQYQEVAGKQYAFSDFEAVTRGMSVYQTCREKMVE